MASSPDLVWLTDAAGTLTFISDAARPMLGIEPTELMGRPYAEIFAPSARRDATMLLKGLATRPRAKSRTRLPLAPIAAIPSAVTQWKLPKGPTS